MPRTTPRTSRLSLCRRIQATVFVVSSSPHPTNAFKLDFPPPPWTPPLRSRSSSGLSPRPPAGSGLGARHGSDDGYHHHADDHPRNAEPPPGTPCPGVSERDGWNQTTNDDDGGGGRRCPGGGVLGKEFDEEVERQRAQEVAAERGRKRGSGKRCKTREKASRSLTRLVHSATAVERISSPS